MANDTSTGGADRGEPRRDDPVGTPDTPAGGTPDTPEAPEGAVGDDTLAAAPADTVRPWGESGAPHETEAAPPSAPGDDGRPAPEIAPTPASRGGALRPVVWTLVVLAVLAGAAFVTRPYWQPHLAAIVPGRGAGESELEQSVAGLASEQAVVRQTLIVLRDRVGELQDRLAAMTERPEAGVGGEPETAALGPVEERLTALDRSVADAARRADSLEYRIQAVDERLGTLTGRIDALAQDVARIGAAPTAVEALVARVAQLEADSLQAKRLADRVREIDAAAVEQRQQAGDTVATALAVNQLHLALRGSGPFAAALNSLQAVAGDDEAVRVAVETLGPLAAAGVPTTEQLRARFPAVASAVARAKAAVAGGGWAERTLNSITSLVAIRRTGEAAVAGGGTDAALARAEAALDAGDLAAAVDAVAAIEGPVADAAGRWLADARARLAAEEALAALQGRVTARLGDARS
jgi:hypothetical protein